MKRPDRRVVTLCLLTGAALDDRAIPYRSAGYGAPQLLLVGNEQQGIPEALKLACE